MASHPPADRPGPDPVHPSRTQPSGPDAAHRHSPGQDRQLHTDAPDWDESSDQAPGPLERPDHLHVERYEHGSWMRANITTITKFHHGWLRLTDDTLEFHHHRIGHSTEIMWRRSDIRDCTVEPLTPTPRIVPGPQPGIAGYYNAWRVTITHDDGHSRMFVLWDPDQVDALEETLAAR